MRACLRTSSNLSAPAAFLSLLAGPFFLAFSSLVSGWHPNELKMLFRNGLSHSTFKKQEHSLTARRSYLREFFARRLLPRLQAPSFALTYTRTQVGKTEITGAQCLSIESRQSPCGVRLQQRLQTAQVCFRPAQCPAPKVRPEHPSLRAFRQFPHSDA